MKLNWQGVRKVVTADYNNSCYDKHCAEISSLCDCSSNVELSCRPRPLCLSASGLGVFSQPEGSWLIAPGGNDLVIRGVWSHSQHREKCVKTFGDIGLGKRRLQD